MSRRNQKRSSLKIIGMFIITPVVAASIAIASVASTSEGYSWGYDFSNLGSTKLSNPSNISNISIQNFPLLDYQNLDDVIEAEAAAKAASTAQIEECANPDQEGTLANAQKKAIEDARKMDTAGINLDDVFKLGGNGCFDALGNFPDLSVMIPSISEIAASLKQALVDYATRKVCQAVNSALEEALSPIQDSMDKLSKRGSLDLNGEINKEMLRKMYGIDAELGRVSQSSPPAKKVDFKW